MSNIIKEKGRDSLQANIIQEEIDESNTKLSQLREQQQELKTKVDL